MTQPINVLSLREEQCNDMNGAQVLVKLLEQHGVTHVFGIPGAKVDSVFEALLDSSIELVLCRHE